MSCAVDSSVPRRIRALVYANWFWIVATVLTTLLLAALPLLWDRRYFFHGDTQVAYSGWWYELGDQVLHGRLPLLNPRAWESGNYIAEGQWGLFSPLTILIAIAVRLAPNVLAVVTLVKVAFIAIGALGTYFLLRSYRITPASAYIGGVLVGIGGASVYYDWQAWVNGQMATSLLPWAWWFTRRAMRGRNPLPALIACYLVVSIGYVYAALYLAFVIVACLVDAGLARDRAAFLRSLAIGVFSALVAVTVYLPGIRTAPVTVRSGWEVSSIGTFHVSVSDVFTSMLPTTNLYYLAWCLPLILWIDAGRAKVALRDLRGALVGTVIAFAWALGPDQIGPLRWPARIQPALMVLLVVLLVVLVSRSLRTPSGPRLMASLGWLLAATWIVVSRDWESLGTTLIGALVVAAAIGAVAWSLRGSREIAALVIGAGTVAVFVTQHAVTTGADANDRHSPARASGYRTQLPDAEGDVMVIGDYSAQSFTRPRLAKELLVGSTWYRNPATVQNSYTTIRFRTFNARFCRTYNGLTCPGALRAVLATEPTTGRPWVDLLSISTLVMYRPDFSAAVLVPPTGWRLAGTTRWTVTWVRDRPVRTAGGVVSTSSGVRISEQHVGTRSAELRVDRVPAGGGTVVFSRLAWPGYEVSGASLRAPTAEILVTVHLDPSVAGHTVRLTWNPPGWHTELAAWWLAVLGGLGWSTAVVVIGRRYRRRARAASGESGPWGEHDASIEPPSRGRREDQSDDVR